MPPFLCIGHRGAAGYEPENTLRSIRHALELGANGIEIDVRLSSDGKLVVIHDARLRRTTGSPGFVSRKTLADLKLRDAGKGEQIPTLKEVLDLIAGRAWLNIELKAKGTAALVIEEVNAAVEAGDTGWSYAKIVVSSFDRRELSTIAREPRIQVGVLVARRPVNVPKLAARFKPWSINLPLHLATQERVDRIHASGLRVLVFTVNDAADIIRLRKMGVDGVFTDFPDRAVDSAHKGGHESPKSS